MTASVIPPAPPIANAHLVLKLNSDVISRALCAKTFSENHMRVNSIDFTSDGHNMLTSSDDDSVVIYNCQNGTRHRSVNSKKYGVSLIRFTHSNSTGIHCSTKLDDSIRYLSLHDNKYIRYFPGHSEKVMSLEMAPYEDVFVSASKDKTIRLWDLRSPHAQGLLRTTCDPVCAFDPEGLVLAAGTDNQTLRLYDLRYFDKGPFETFEIPPDPTSDWTSIKFSPDGRFVMIGSNGETIKLIDAYNGNIKHELRGHSNEEHLALSASFTPDSQFVFTGGSDGKIHAWDVESGRETVSLRTSHTGFIQQVAFNPRYFIMVSACTTVCMWLPPEDATVAALER